MPVCQGMGLALPHYLPYCLTPEAEYNKMETEFLIYNFGCADKYKDNMRTQLSCLTMRQLRCLILFIEYLSVQPRWSEYCPKEIARALEAVNVDELYGKLTRKSLG